MTTVLFTIPSSPISPNYSGAASRFYQNFKMLHSIGLEVSVIRFITAGDMESITQFEKVDAHAIAIRQMAKDWVDVPLKGVQKPGRIGNWLNLFLNPTSYFFPESEQIRAHLQSVASKYNPQSTMYWVENIAILSSFLKDRVMNSIVYSHHDQYFRLQAIRKGQRGINKLRWLIGQQLEKKINRQAHKILTGSKTEKYRLQKEGNRIVEWIPIGYDLLARDIRADPSSKHINIYHLGSLETTANRLGLEAYLKNIHQEVCRVNLAQGVTTTLKIIGDNRKVAASLKKLLDQENVEVLGFVNDLEKTLEFGNLVVLPYEQDSGYRTKLPLLLSLGMVVVATESSIRGNDLTDDQVKECLCRVDTLDEMKEKIPELCVRSDLRINMAKKAIGLYEKSFKMESFSRKYLKLAKGHAD